MLTAGLLLIERQWTALSEFPDPEPADRLGSVGLQVLCCPDTLPRA